MNCPCAGDRDGDREWMTKREEVLSTVCRRSTNAQCAGGLFYAHVHVSHVLVNFPPASSTMAFLYARAVTRSMPVIPDMSLASLQAPASNNTSIADTCTCCMHIQRKPGGRMRGDGIYGGRGEE